MKNKNYAWGLGLIAIITIILIITLSSPAEAETIKIGWMGPLSGDLSSMGQNWQKVTQLSAEEINARGGIDGKKIELIFEDSRCNSQDAITAANKLINIDGVKYIVGGACSSATLSAAPMAEENHVVMISYGASSPDVTEAGDYIFRNYPSDLYQAEVIANYAYDALGVRRVAVLYDLGNWGSLLQDKFSEAFTQLGGEVVATEGYMQDTNDVKTQLEKIKVQDPEMIYFLGYTKASIVGLKQIKELGIKAKIIGADTWEDSKIWSEVGDMEATHISPYSKSEPAFVYKIKNIGVDEGVQIGTAQTYDAIKILAQQIAIVGDDSTAVKESLYTMSPYDGATGLISFDENGDLVGIRYEISEIKSGQPQTVAVV